MAVYGERDFASTSTTTTTAPKEETVTKAEATSLGLTSTEGITKKDGVYYFDKSLGFEPVGVAKPGEVQMTPYYSSATNKNPQNIYEDMADDYMLTQEQFAAIYKQAKGDINEISRLQLEQMQKNIKTAQDTRYQRYLIELKEKNPGYWQENIERMAREMAYGVTSGKFTFFPDYINGPQTSIRPGTGQPRYNAQGQQVANGQYNAYGEYIGYSMNPEQQSMFSVLSDRFKKYNLESLVPKIKQLIISGATEDTITIALQESEEYQQRFKANKARMAKGLQVLTPADYLRVEDGYRQTLRAYGLTQFDSDEYVSKFIENDMSPGELSARVNIAVQRLRDADKEITKTLRDYYNLGETDILAYMLDPEKQLPALQRQITAAEIGTAARKQGLAVASATAEELAAKGVTQAEAEQGYATIADILPTAQKLSDIYGGTLEGYNLTEAEQEVFGQLASAQRKRKTLAKREVSTFGGTSGLGRSSLSSQSGGGF